MPGFSGSAIVRVVILPSPIPSTTDLVIFNLIFCQNILFERSLIPDAMANACSLGEGVLAVGFMSSQQNLQKFSQNISSVSFHHYNVQHCYAV